VPHEPTRDMAEFPGSLDATFLKDLQVRPCSWTGGTWRGASGPALRDVYCLAIRKACNNCVPVVEGETRERRNSEVHCFFSPPLPDP